SLRAPVVVYGIAISVMLWSAWATLYRADWSAPQRACVIVGATLFFISDAMLAWNRFVKPFAAAKLAVIITYHLGQIALALTLMV
ncbi:lysoplasmalogenase, partial [Anaerolineae bacterium CFX7]|nr:lysoplasmalogenase [Anaerolineae bacterium CFX7]